MRSSTGVVVLTRHAVDMSALSFESWEFDCFVDGRDARWGLPLDYGLAVRRRKRFSTRWNVDHVNRKI